MQTDTRTIVEAFFHAWTAGDAAATRALLADDLEYSGPLNTYHRADELVPPLMKFVSILRGANLLEVIVDGDRAALLYECQLPEPVGTLRTASFQRVERGKIQTYRQEFDATALRVLLKGG